MKKINAEGEKICRYHRQPRLRNDLPAGPWFEEIAKSYQDDEYELLQEIGLTERVEGEWVVDKRMKAGKWHYQSRIDEFSWLPFLWSLRFDFYVVDKR